MSEHRLRPGERISRYNVLIYTEQWCNGEDLGACSCGDIPDLAYKGHWRSSRRIELDDLIRIVAERQREISAQHLDNLLREKKATAIWVGADEMRQAPLATLPKDEP